MIPMLIPTKGRAGLASTFDLFKDLCEIYAIIEPQERDVYAEKHPYLKFVLQSGTNQGIGSARQQGIAAFQRMGRDWVWMADDDITGFVKNDGSRRSLVTAGAVMEEAYALAKENPRFGLIGFSGIRDRWRLARNLRPIERMHGVYRCILINLDAKINFKPVKWANEDVDFCLQYMAAGREVLRLSPIEIQSAMDGKGMEGGLKEDYKRESWQRDSLKWLMEQWPGVVELKPGKKPGQQIVHFDRVMKLKRFAKSDAWGNVIPDVRKKPIPSRDRQEINYDLAVSRTKEGVLAKHIYHINGVARSLMFIYKGTASKECPDHVFALAGLFNLNQLFPKKPIPVSVNSQFPLTAGLSGLVRRFLRDRRLSELRFHGETIKAQVAFDAPPCKWEKSKRPEGRNTLMLSFGKESMLTLELLKAHGKIPQCVFIGIGKNIVKESRALAEKVGVDIQIVKHNFYPFIKSVGRGVWGGIYHQMIAAPFAWLNGSRELLIGDESETRIEREAYGYVLPSSYQQSREYEDFTGKVLSEAFGWPVRCYSLLGGMPEALVIRTLFTKFPQAVENVRSCWGWGKRAGGPAWCGKCIKCYYFDETCRELGLNSPVKMRVAKEPKDATFEPALKDKESNAKLKDGIVEAGTRYLGQHSNIPDADLESLVRKACGDAV